jgi:tetratricopeptide (TPR) repeat protein
VQAGTISIEDGHVITREGLDREHEESAQVYQRIHDRALFNSADGRVKLDASAMTSLNARASRAIGPRGPDVLPWGAWAEFSQRHLAMLIGNVDRFYRHRYGDAARADTVRAQLDAHLGGLTLFPVATTLRTKGVKGGDADLTHINEAITLGVTAPELVTARLWTWLETGGRYEPLRRAMPMAAQWFVMPSARVPYDGALRMEHLAHRPERAATMAALWTEAPYDHWLATNHLEAAHAKAPPDAEVHRVLGPRLGYDLRAIRQAATQVNDDLAKLMLRERGCEIAVTECGSYARMLATLKRPDDAAREFERTFADPSYDRVAFANETGWLVDYYYERKKIDRALELAEEAANVGSARGLYTAGGLYERLGRDEDAEEVYEQAATRYEDPSQLLGFYRRAVYERKKTDFERGWTRWLPVMFPQGLTPAAAAAHSVPKPERGVTVMNDSAQLRKAGLQAGDLIIGLEGWRVDNLQQFRTIDAFDDRPERTLTVWRGPIYQVKLPARSWRGTSVEFRTYPVLGWAE